MRPDPYPDDIKPLTSLRFVAAIWVLLYHFRDHLGLDLGRFGLVANGWMGVDLFFMLSGFILAHVYLKAAETGRFDYGRFLQNRLARLYPMHLTALAAMIVLFLGARAAGVSPGAADAFKWSDLPAHLLLLHAWGTTASVGWNFPSWSISAEWGAYLVFPLIATLVLRARPGVMVGAALVLCLGAYWALDHLHEWTPGVGRGFEQMTAQIGVLRILPTFLLGVSLYAFGRMRATPGWPLALAGAASIVGVTSFNLWPALAWPGLAALILGLAQTARTHSEGLFAHKSFVFLGAASYALYMLHLPIDIAYFHALERIGLDETSAAPVRIAALVGVFLVCVIASAIAYSWIEEPARRFVRGLQWPRRAAPQPGV